MSHAFKSDLGAVVLGGKENIISRKLYRSTLRDISRSSVLPLHPIKTSATKRQLSPEKEYTLMSNKKRACDLAQTTPNKCVRDAFPPDDHLSHLMRLERELMPKHNYLETTQKHITDQHRSITVRNQTQCAYALRMSSGATFMSITYMDRFLSTYAMEVRHLSILCAASLFVASKFEDTIDTQFNVDELLEVCELRGNNARATLLNMEAKLLRTLDYRLSQPTSKSFIVLFFTKSGIFDNRTYYFALFLAQIFQTDCACLKYMPSLIGKLVACIAINTCNEVDCCHNRYLSSEVAELGSSDIAKFCIRDLQRSVECEKNDHGDASPIILRYASNTYLNVADIDNIHFDI